jgi:quercetin dioxygenase-like cupin family protein
MRVHTITIPSLSLLASSSACTRQTGTKTGSAAPSTAPVQDSLTINRRDARPVQQGPADWFTGTAHIEPLFAASAKSRAAGASVSFEPGARTAWHTHPRGQVLIVTAGIGRVQRRGGPVEEIREGDVIWTPPGVEHWHGASPTSAMTHIAIQEHVDGKVVEWGRKVTGAEYESR